MKKMILQMVLALILVAGLSSAVVINSVNTPLISPGDEGEIRIEVENTLNTDVQDVSIALKFETLPFIPIGTSEQLVDEINEDDDEDFVFRIKSSSDAKAGDYEIPYTLQYEINGETKTRTGTIGLRVRASPDLVFSISTENPVVGQRGKITLKIINKGFSDARFVSVTALSDGFTILSDSQEYIGTIDSDDFETATFDVLFKKANPDFNAILEYKDSDNSVIRETLVLPVEVYTKEKAVELGIIKQNFLPYYLGGAVVVVAVYLIYRSIKKRRRLRKSMQQGR